VIPAVVLLRKLGRKDLDRLDHGWLLQQLRRLGHQRGGYLAAEVCLAARVVGEGVEDAELRGNPTVPSGCPTANASAAPSDPAT